jgi:hypothetical protein
VVSLSLPHFFASNAQGSAAYLQTGNAGNTSEDQADEASYGQHDNRRKGKKPKHPKLLSILIGALIVAE